MSDRGHRPAAGTGVLRSAWPAGAPRDLFRRPHDGINPRADACGGAVLQYAGGGSFPFVGRGLLCRLRRRRSRACLFL